MSNRRPSLKRNEDGNVDEDDSQNNKNSLRIDIWVIVNIILKIIVIGLIIYTIWMNNKILNSEKTYNTENKETN